MADGSELKCIVPIVEFFEIRYGDSQHGARYEIISADAGKYANGVKRALREANGIYLFYDSRGRALYAGKAQNQPLWDEMNAAYNRDRGDLQKIRLVAHPAEREYTPYEEKVRQPEPVKVDLSYLAYYFSAYRVEPNSMIGMFEALIVRAFANDLLNKKMEKF
jgi:hypothetical protein